MLKNNILTGSPFIAEAVALCANVTLCIKDYAKTYVAIMVNLFNNRSTTTSLQVKDYRLKPFRFNVRFDIVFRMLIMTMNNKHLISIKLRALFSWLILWKILRWHVFISIGYIVFFKNSLEINIFYSPMCPKEFILFNT